MNNLQGINLINKYGYYIGVLEDYILKRDSNKYIIYYVKNNRYCDGTAEKDNFEAYMKIAKIKSDRYDFIKKRNINHIYHFSPIENTASILDYGLVSRDVASHSNIPLIITDYNRFDGELNRISASISFPNYRMRYSLEMQGYNLIIYDISPRILLSKLDTQFYYTNAANSVFNSINKDSLTTNEALEGMFTSVNREPNLCISYTTDPQAELLVDTSIDKGFINGVISRSEDIKIKKLCYQKDFSYGVDGSLYGPRCDYSRWSNGN